MPPESEAAIFADIYRRNGFGGHESVSGPGSDLEQTERLAEALPGLLRDLGVRTLLDIPCGDFHWLSTVDLGPVEYIGADIVPDLVERAAREHGRPGVTFRVLDLLEDDLPQADLVLCRDCLVHLSLAAGLQALANLRRSAAAYALLTTFPSRPENGEIPTGRWRTLNLERPPFSLPAPLRLLNEGCTEASGAFADKSLGLWRVADLGRTR